MPLTPQEWHRRFVEQAGWTEAIRRSLFSRLELGGVQRVLDTGCGTGALLPELGEISSQVHGIDLDSAFLRIAAQGHPHASLALGDANQLPYAAGVFDACLCHYLILWLPRPIPILREMKRVTRPGGYVLLLAEPDYGGRIDYPEPLEELGRWQAEALRQQGANPNTGRQLAGMLMEIGLEQVTSGVLGGEWAAATTDGSGDEWLVLGADLAGQLPEAELDHLRQVDRLARRRGERILFVPTFYAWGRKPV